jgi:hypothetical protein
MPLLRYFAAESGSLSVPFDAFECTLKTFILGFEERDGYIPATCLFRGTYRAKLAPLPLLFDDLEGTLRTFIPGLGEEENDRTRGQSDALNHSKQIA